MPLRDQREFMERGRTPKSQVPPPHLRGSHQLKKVFHIILIYFMFISSLLSLRVIPSSVVS